MFWKVRATPRWTISCDGSPLISCPSRRIVPLSRSVSPVIRLKSVVFPDPFGPMTLTSSPAYTVSVMPSAAATPPNRLVRPSISSSGRAGASAALGVAHESSTLPSRLGRAVCCSRVSAATRRMAGHSPSRRNSIIRTRIRPKISSSAVMSCTFWR